MRNTTKFVSQFLERKILRYDFWKPFTISGKSFSLKSENLLDLKRYAHPAVSPLIHTERQTVGAHGSTDPTGQPEPRGLVIDRTDLATGEPNGEAVSASVLGAPSRTDRCPNLAGWFNGASSLARMAHGGATSPRPHLAGARHGGPRSARAPASPDEADARERREGRRWKQPTRVEPSSDERRW
jgi:hypothetical protein